MTRHHYTKGPCRAAQITIRGQKVWAIRCRNEVVGIAYNGQTDAELWARAPRLLASLEALTSTKPNTHAHETALTTAQALVAELR